MAATLTTTPGAPSTSLQRLHHVEKVVSRTSLSVCLSVSLWMLVFLSLPKALGQKKAYKHVFLFEDTPLLWYLKEGEKKLLFEDRSFGAVML
jgi:hypothetical protein